MFNPRGPSVKPEITCENSLHQITIIGADKIEKNAINLEFIKETLPSNMHIIKSEENMKSEKSEEANPPKDEPTLNDWQAPELDFKGIKKKPNIIDFDIVQDTNSNNNNNDHIWTNLNDTNLQEGGVTIKWEVEEYNETSNSSDYFIENFIGIENKNGKYLKEEDSTFFDPHQSFTFIKEDNIELEDHCVMPVTSQNMCMVIEQERNKPGNDEPLFECNLCDYKTRTRNHLKIHWAVHEDPNKLLWYYCTKCSYKTRQKGHLRRHDLIHCQLGELEMFTCAICDYKCKQKCTLKRHIANVHTSHKSNNTHSMTDDNFWPIYKCSNCSYSTPKRGLLMSHLDKHKDAQDITSLYICDTCSFSTKYRRNLRVHLETHKESQELQVYECKICRFKTRMGYCLKRHFLSKKHLGMVGKLEEYCPRTMKLKQENDS